MVGIITYGANYLRLRWSEGIGGRFWGPRTKKKSNLIESLFFVLLVLAAGYILLQSPLFEVRRVHVQGNYLLIEGKIRSVADIGAGVNIFKLDLETVRSRLKMIPMIKEAQVSRSLPATVVITIKERVPLGILPVQGGFIEVDEEGVNLMTASVGVPGLPVITGVNADDVPPPGQVVHAAGLKDALAVIGGLPGEVVANLSEVHVDGEDRIMLYTIEGIQCKFGQATEIKEKGVIISQLIQELRKIGAKVDYIDLSYAGQPVVYYQKQ